MTNFDPALAPAAGGGTVPTALGPPEPAIRVDQVTRRYGRGRSAVDALRGVSVDLPTGSFTAIMGPSGSGKSTLLQCAAGLDRPTSGRVLLGADDLTTMSESRLTRLRRDRIGFVFQSFNLIPALTARQNITLPLRLAGRRADRAWLTELVERVGLAQRIGHRPTEMSGGQQQRVAIARALITRPAVVFGDEPTGALDLATGKEILTLLREVVDTLGQTLVMVTHDPVAASYADRVLFLADGSIVEGMDGPTADAVAARLTRLGG
ncbi:ABC transporter ATP-binding protein [Actinomadura vinacea]|uniref:ABC transporter ATP-binding protein n=1 Tax=Actinomadura vinacea TaxID=115336 RepID=A0ABN3IEC8_9ACTN